MLQAVSTVFMSKEKNAPTTDEPILTLTGTVLRAGGGAYEVDPPDRSQLAHLADAEPVDSPTPPRSARGPLGHGRRARWGGAERVDSPTRLCSVRGLLKRGRRQAAQPVSVGDNVRVRVLASSGADARGRRLREGQTEEVLPRRSAPQRPRCPTTTTRRH